MSLIPPAVPDVAPLFPIMRAELLRVLRSLSDEQWALPTACAGWSVRDVALHILGDDVGLLSNMRDHDGQYIVFETFDQLVGEINRRNGLWVEATRRISRPLLLTMLDLTGAQWAAFASSIDPDAPGGPIGWTGNQHDPMGLHLARELTEYWMHHQHICEAVGVDSLKDGRFMHAVLSTFIHCLPQTYSAADVPVGAAVKVIITGEGGGHWVVIREPDRWRLYLNSDLPASATITLNTDTAWRLFTKNRPLEALQMGIELAGDVPLGQVIWGAVAILA